MMIFNTIREMHFLINPLAVVTFKRFNHCMTFSTLKQKAEKYLCAAVAYRTLADVDPAKIYSFKPTSTLRDYNNNNGKIEYEPFSLRERVIDNIDKLILDSEQNRKEIRQIFEIQNGLKRKESTVPLSIFYQAQRNMWSKQVSFAFNPTLYFTEMAKKLDEYDSSYSKQVYIGKCGIGKTFNQLLLAHLTHIMYLFRKQGDAALQQLKVLLKRNQQVLKQIMQLTSSEINEIKEKKADFLQLAKKKFDKIPFVYFYNLPDTLDKLKQNNEVGLQMSDYLEYFSEEQIKKLGIKQVHNNMDQTKINQLNISYYCLQNQMKQMKKKKVPLQKLIKIHYNNNTADFFMALRQNCRKNGIKFFLIIDQISMFFEQIRENRYNQNQIKALQGKQGKQYEIREYKDQIFHNNRFIKTHSKILNQFHDVLTQTNIILTASANVYLDSNEQMKQAIFQLHPYAKCFFNKQARIGLYEIKYSEQAHPEIWQKQMDVIFLFQMERQLQKRFDKINELLKNLLPIEFKQKIREIIKQLRYLFHKQMYKDQSKEEMWNNYTKHSFIKLSFRYTSSQVQKSILQVYKGILDLLWMSEKNASAQRLTKVKWDLVSSLKTLKLQVNKNVSYSHRLHLLNHNRMFYLRLIDQVHNLASKPQNAHLVIIPDDILVKILDECNIKAQKRVQYLKLLINKDYQQVIEESGKVYLKNNCSLGDLKQKLQSGLYFGGIALEYICK